MKLKIEPNLRDNDGSKYLYITPENAAEACYIEIFCLSLRMHNILPEEFDLDGNGIKSLKIRILH